MVIRSGRNARAVTALPMRFTSTTRRQTAGSDSRNGPPSATPALATTTEGGPSRARISDAARCMPRSSVTSASQHAEAPVGSASLTRASVRSSRPSSATRAPRSTSTSAIAAPRPRAAPVTTATRPFRGLRSTCMGTPFRFPW